MVVVGCLGWLGPLACTASASNLLYWGGPVVHSANVVLVQWGSDVRTTYTDPTTGDPGFFHYLDSHNGSTADIGGVLAQYMDTTGHNSRNDFSYAGAFQISPAVAATPPGNVLDSDIQTELTNDISGGSLPAPSGSGLSTVYVVLFPPGDDVCFDGGAGCAYDATSGFCAYHGSFTLSGSTHVLYAAIPDNGPGTANYGYCGPSSVDLQNQTSTVSHELGETINDPLVAEAAGSGPPLGWYDLVYNGEIADKCDGAPLASNGPWAVEPLWSNVDGNCTAAEPAYSAPTASFLGPASAPPQQDVTFDASSSSDPTQDHASALEQGIGSTYSISSGITRYHWNWGDGSPSTTDTAATATHAFAAAGTYAVSLTVTDALGFTSTTTHQVTVSGGGSVPPVATTGSATGIDYQGATVQGTVNPEGQALSYQFNYGTSAGSLDQSTPVSTGPGGSTAVPVSATLSGLQPSTTYYYQLAISAGGSEYTGTVGTFTTNASPPAPQNPVVASGPAARIGTSGALLTGTLNPDGPADVQYAFSYGTSPSVLDHSTGLSTQPAGTTAAPVSATVMGLSPNTTYYFRLDVSLGGRTYSGQVRSFKTRVPPPGARTGAAIDVTRSSAVIPGWVNPHGFSTTYQVQFGPTAEHGLSTTWIKAGSANFNERVNAVLLGLRPSTTYHYRLVAQSNGGTIVGADRTFTTARRLGLAPRFAFRLPATMPLHRLRSHRLRARFECSRSCTAHFVLTLAPRGVSRSGAVSLTVARGESRLRRAGWGMVTLHFTARFRNALSQTANRRVGLIALGYATARNRAASRPRQVRITLT